MTKIYTDTAHPEIVVLETEGGKHKIAIPREALEDPADSRSATFTELSATVAKQVDAITSRVSEGSTAA